VTCPLFGNCSRQDCRTLLQLLKIDHGFFKADPKYWQQNNGCITAHNFVKNLNAANDASARVLGLLTAFNIGKVTRSKKQQEYLRRIISMPQQTQYETVTACERVTKPILQSVRKHLDFL